MQAWLWTRAEEAAEKERRKRTFQGSYAKIICKLLVCWKNRTEHSEEEACVLARKEVKSQRELSDFSARCRYAFDIDMIVWVRGAIECCALHTLHAYIERVFAAIILPFYMYWSLCVCVAEGRGENAATRWRDSSETPLIKVKIQRKNWGAILSSFGPPRNWDGCEKMGK